MAPYDDGINADGILVQIDAGNLSDNDVVSIGEDGRFQGATAPPVGRNPYPTVPLKVKPCKAASACIGMTLSQTLSHDENSENLLYNPVKKDELNAVLSGQAVPLATRGIFTLTQEAFGFAEGASTATWQNEMAPGNELEACVAVPGNFTGDASAGAGIRVGVVLATGERVDHGSADSWAGKYPIIQLSLPCN